MKWRSLEESTTGPDARTLREQFAERKELIAKYVPAEAQAIHTRVVADLKRQGIESTALRVGAKAPQFELRDHSDRLVRSADLLAQGPLVLCFIRGRWCPFCVAQLEAMNQALSEIRAAGASLLAISPQTVKQSFFMVDQHKLRFPVLSDVRNEVARQFGLIYRVPEDQQAIYRRAFINLPFANGDDSWELPVPAVYVIDGIGIVAHASVNADFTERPEPTEILKALRA